ncbi:nicotianamine synthase 2 [Striga asiatica]|uniref:Nicotianamine synthase 2 n=1 Tax=Striga asiatica TaxID=4170 RepID=A0A5A7PSH6_STRAF|nr:nicotianamine synthase 2 [Striga asiatica]
MGNVSSVPPPSDPQSKRLTIPLAVTGIDMRDDSAGIDLTCNSCGLFIPKSQELYNCYMYYPPDGPQGSPLMRCFVRCPNCRDILVVGLNIGDEENLVVLCDDTADYFAAPNTVPRCHLRLQPVGSGEVDEVAQGVDWRTLQQTRHRPIGRRV